MGLAFIAVVLEQLPGVPLVAAILGAARSREAAEKINDDWVGRAWASGIDLLVRMGNRIKTYKSNILNWYDHRILQRIVNENEQAAVAVLLAKTPAFIQLRWENGPGRIYFAVMCHFQAQLAISGKLAGINNKIKDLKHMAYGFRTLNFSS